MPQKIVPYSASQSSRSDTAQRLRSTSTDAERKLWGLLRNRQLEGWKFRRQVPIRGYIVDFACFEGNLIIEVDGGHHQEQAGHDEERAKRLADGGFRVLRFWNNQVLGEVESVLETILAALESSDSSD